MEEQHFEGRLAFLRPSIWHDQRDAAAKARPVIRTAEGAPGRGGVRRGEAPMEGIGQVTVYHQMLLRCGEWRGVGTPIGDADFLKNVRQRVSRQGRGGHGGLSRKGGMLRRLVGGEAIGAQWKPGDRGRDVVVMVVVVVVMEAGGIGTEGNWVWVGVRRLMIGVGTEVWIMKRSCSQRIRRHRDRRIERGVVKGIGRRQGVTQRARVVEGLGR